jgi:hypothetical protein
MTQTSNIFILGAGHFGMRAAEALRRRSPEAEITVVDTDKKALKDAAELGFETAPMDAISFLMLNEKRMAPDDWIVPAVPIHVAYEWIRQKLRREAVFAELPIPNEVLAALPNPSRGERGQVFATNATFTCPDDCPEPEEICTVTGEPRPQVLCATLSSLAVPGYRSVGIVSNQMAPGVGGFQLVAFRHAMTDITAEPGKILFSTACKCHGVLHSFEWGPKSDIE